MSKTTVVLALILAGTNLFAQDRQGPRPEVSARRLIDDEIGKAREAAGLKAAPRSDDAEFLRRVCLDIIGTIPTPGRARQFLADAGPEKRSALIEELLASPGYARNWSHVWSAAILGVGDVRFQDEVAAKLPRAIEEFFVRNAPLDELARSVISFQSPKPQGDARKERDGLTLFYTELFVRAGKEFPQFLAGRFSRVFLGYQIQCARCHDHPFDRWTQEEFYGMAAFFAGTRHEAFGVGDRPPGQVKGLKIPDSKSPPLPPSFLESRGSSRPAETLRAAFARILTEPGNLQFARSVVNRVWATLFGRGFVTPMDAFNPTNPPTHPELLEALARELQARRFDLQWLIREICHSETYQLSGRAKTRDRDHERHYASASIRALRPEQLVDSLLTATGLDEAGGSLTRDKALREFRSILGYEFGIPGNRFQGGIPAALLMLNGSMVSQGTAAPSAGSPTRLGRILKHSADEGRRLEEIFLATLSRFPRDEERDRCLAAVRSKGDQGYADVMAAILNSAEFLLSH